jgi:hypothetical protein
MDIGVFGKAAVSFRRNEPRPGIPLFCVKVVVTAGASPGLGT